PKRRKLDKNGRPKASWRDTEYGIGWVPLGGYCKIAGMIDESMDKEQMAREPQPDEFRSRPAWQRLLVMIGGVLFNFILAIIIYAGIAWKWGADVLPFGSVTEGFNYSTEAKAYGYHDGDRILAVDGVDFSTRNIDDLYAVADAKQVTVIRGNDTIIIDNPANFVTMLPNGLFDKDAPFRYPAYADQVSLGSPAHHAGLIEGDRFVAINDVATPTFDDVKATIAANDGREMKVTVERGDSLVNLAITPSGGTIGFVTRNPLKIYNVEHINYNLLQAFPKGVSDGCTKMTTYVKSLKHLFSKKGAQSVGGFGAIGEMFPSKWNWLTFWELCAFLSVILAFMNILPIPALDGGHVMFVLYEIITRRKPSEKFLERAQMVGMCLLLALLLFANGNDIYRMIFK
ncbi:MAG: RIP metalloprotease RseP, partial [Muribaculaceae bacterium]|nr:RIP metalloprotease RseP [Muribaculaceae bacterium]